MSCTQQQDKRQERQTMKNRWKTDGEPTHALAESCCVISIFAAALQTIFSAVAKILISWYAAGNDDID
jgi:hypothetical protein